MAAPPLRTEISDTYPLPSDATARAGFGKFWDYVTGLLGATGNAAEARAALGLSDPRPNFTNASAMVAQRATAGALSTSRVIGQSDNIGMWASAGAVSAGTISQVTTAICGVTGYAARAAGMTLTGAAVLSQSIRMESRDALRYKNQTASFQVKVDHDVGASVNYTLVVKKPTVADNFASRTTIATGVATAVATGTATTLTFTGVALGDCTNGLELEVQAACGAVTTKNFNVTEFKVELGSVATGFAAREYQAELALCLRYLPVTPASTTLITNTASTTLSIAYFKFPVEARVAPTGFTASALANLVLANFGGAVGTPTACAFSSASTTSGRFSITTTAGAPSIYGGATGEFQCGSAGFLHWTGSEL